MATVLNTISLLEDIDITLSELVSTRLASYVKQLRRQTTNQYLSHRLKILLKKWHKLWLTPIEPSPSFNWSLPNEFSAA